MAYKNKIVSNRKATGNRKKTNSPKKTNKFVIVTLYGLLLLTMVYFSSMLKPQILSAEAEEQETTSSGEFWAGVSYSDMDILPVAEVTIPAVPTRGDSSQLQPTATGILTHVTSSNETILLSTLLKELGQATEENALETAKQVSAITCPEQYFTATKLENGDWQIYTKRSFDTLEQVVLTKNGEDVPIVFKDSLFTTDLNALCTNVELIVNGKAYNQDNVWGSETIYVSPKKLYELDLTFTENPSKQFSNYEELEYTLPQGFILPEYFNEMGYTLSISMDIGGILKDNPVRCDETRTKLYIRWNQEDEDKFNYFHVPAWRPLR